MFRKNLIRIAVGAVVSCLVPGTAVAGLPGGPNTPQPVQTFSVGSFPESMTADGGHLDVTLGHTGQIVDVSGSQLTLLGTIALPFESLLTGITGDGTYLYVANANYGTGVSAIYRSDNLATPWVTLGQGSFPNGLAVDNDTLYVADSYLGRIWSIPLGTTAATPDVWCDDAVLAPNRGLGVNGITFHSGWLYASVSDTGRVVRFPATGSHCGAAEDVTTQQQLTTVDGITFAGDMLYLAVNATNKLYAYEEATKTTTLLADRSMGLSYPTQPAWFQGALYLTNGAFVNGVPTLERFTSFKR